MWLREGSRAAQAGGIYNRTCFAPACAEQCGVVWGASGTAWAYDAACVAAACTAQEAVIAADVADLGDHPDHAACNATWNAHVRECDDASDCNVVTDTGGGDFGTMRFVGLPGLPGPPPYPQPLPDRPPNCRNPCLRP